MDKMNRSGPSVGVPWGGPGAELGPVWGWEWALWAGNKEFPQGENGGGGEGGGPRGAAGARAECSLVSPGWLWGQTPADRPQPCGFGP